MDEFENYQVICHSPGCGNADHPIIVQALATDPLIICGVCGITITDITPAGALS